MLFLLVGGIWADRLPRHRVMVFSNVVSGLSQGAIAVLLLTGQAVVWQLMALGAVNGLSSFVLIPLGLAVAGPVAQVIGTRATILAAAAISLTATLAVLFVPDVRTISRRDE